VFKKVIKYTVSYSLTILVMGGIIMSFIWTPDTAPLLGKLNDLSLFMVIVAYVIAVVVICCVAAMIAWIGFCIFLIGDTVHKQLWRER